MVQNMYLKLAEMEIREGTLNRIQNNNGSVNTVYVFKILSNLVVDEVRRGSKETRLDDSIDIPINDEIVDDKAYNELIEGIKIVIDDMHQYDKMLLELHFVYDMSMRAIQRKTDIPTHSIFNTLKNAKQKIKQETSQRYRKYVDDRNDRETSDGIGRHNPEGNEGDWH
jgi:DNA-directed RNA polymerase specialized sigma24 family protein